MTTPVSARNLCRCCARVVGVNVATEISKASARAIVYSQYAVKHALLSNAALTLPGSGVTVTVTGDARGDANAVWVFQIASSLGTASGSAVTLAGGAKAKNVFWQVGTSASLGTTTDFKGTIMADQSITLANGATLQGRALARIASVTMDDNAVSLPPK